MKCILFYFTTSPLFLTGCAGIEVWLPRWRKKDFRTSQGTRAKNSELVRYADALTTMRRQAGQGVRFQHVRGHAGEPGNEGADALAVRGTKLVDKADARNWDDLRLRLEKGKKTAVKAESVDASVSPSKDLWAGKWLTSPCG
jgi:hypothetical protein